MPGADLLIRNGRVVTPEGVVDADVAVRDGSIIGIGTFDNPAARTRSTRPAGWSCPAGSMCMPISNRCRAWA
jgi:dihydropyrimidinase